MSISPSNKRSSNSSSSSDPSAKKLKTFSLFAKSPEDKFPVLSDNPLPPLWSTERKEREGAQRVLISTWNVCGLKSANLEKNEFAFRKYIEAEQPDIIILTEVKYPEASSSPDLAFLSRYFPGGRYWGYQTAAFCKVKPLKATFGLPDWAKTNKEEGEARLITLDYPTIFIVGIYAQNSGAKKAGVPHENFSKKLQWNIDLTRYLNFLQKQKPIIFTGDFNAILDKIDLENPLMNWEKQPGTYPEERKGHSKLIDECGLKDVWREWHPNEREYTHSSALFKGWRLDGYLVSKELMQDATISATSEPDVSKKEEKEAKKGRIVSCTIRHEVHNHFTKGSDHWPVVLVLDGAL